MKKKLKMIIAAIVAVIISCNAMGQSTCNKPCGNPNAGSNKTSCCAGNPVNIGVANCFGTNQCPLGCGGFTYSWAPAGGTNCTATVYPTSNTTYTLYITYPSCCCCDASTGDCGSGTCPAGVRSSTMNVTFSGSCCARINPDSMKIINTEGIKIYPNPASKILYITSPNLSVSLTTTMAIYDSNGKAVGNYDITEKNDHFDLEHLAKGIYFIRVFHPDKDIMFEKIIIE